VLHQLRDAGNTIVVIEHNLDVIKTADWIVDLGPEGGDAGGEIIATGTPEQIAEAPESYTGLFLRLLLVGGHVVMPVAPSPSTNGVAAHHPPVAVIDRPR